MTFNCLKCGTSFHSDQFVIIPVKERMTAVITCPVCGVDVGKSTPRYMICDGCPVRKNSCNREQAQTRRCERAYTLGFNHGFRTAQIQEEPVGETK